MSVSFCRAHTYWDCILFDGGIDLGTVESNVGYVRLRLLALLLNQGYERDQKPSLA